MPQAITLLPRSLATLVEQALTARMGAGPPFTAYDITTGLRQAHPHRDVPHQGAQGVRALVHTQMEPLVAAGQAGRATIRTATGYAIQYTPLTPPATGMRGRVRRLVGRLHPQRDSRGATPLRPTPPTPSADPRAALAALTPVQSSAVTALGYDPTAEILAVKLTSGATYCYRGVPPTVAADLRAAPSIGHFYATQIAGPGIYLYQRV